MANTTYERAGAAAVLTITRPERRNAVDADTAAELLDAYRRFEADDEARVLVLTGEGPEAFCAGADLKAVAERGAAFTGDDPQAAVDEWLDAVPAGPLGFTRLTSTKPTIAAVSGWCLAGGLELALWCDLRICTASGRFGYPERRWGVPLIDGGTQRLPLIVGMGRALELILTGRIIDARRGPHLGSRQRGRGRGRPPHSRPGDRRGARVVPAADDALGPGRGDRRRRPPLDDGLALEERLGRQSVITGVLGAARFAEGEGRGGEGAGA